MKTTFSVSSRSAASTRSLLAMYLRGFDISGSLECESGFAGGLRERFDATVIFEAATIEDDGGDALFFCFPGQRLTDKPGDFALLLLAIASRLDIGLEVAGGHERVARAVVDDLRVDVFEAAEDGEAGAFGSACEAFANAEVTSSAGGAGETGLLHKKASRAASPHPDKGMVRDSPMRPAGRRLKSAGKNASDPAKSELKVSWAAPAEDSNTEAVGK